MSHLILKGGIGGTPQAKLRFPRPFLKNSASAVLGPWEGRRNAASPPLQAITCELDSPRHTSGKEQPALGLKPRLPQTLGTLP